MESNYTEKWVGIEDIEWELNCSVSRQLAVYKNEIHIVLILKFWWWALCMGSLGIVLLGFVTYLTTHDEHKPRKWKYELLLSWEDAPENRHFKWSTLRVELLICLNLFIWISFLCSCSPETHYLTKFCLKLNPSASRSPMLAS